MADPLSITASCVGIVAFTTQTTTAVSVFVRGVRDARHDLAATSRQLAELGIVLDLLGLEYDDHNPRSTPGSGGSGSAASPSSTVPNSIKAQILSILDNYEEVLRDISALLESYQKGALRSTKWALKGESDIAGLNKQLEAHRCALNIALEVSTIAVIRRVKDDTAQLVQSTSLLRVDTASIIRRADLAKGDTESIIRHTTLVKDDTDQILQEIARLQDLVANATSMHCDDYNPLFGPVMKRYLDSMTEFTGSVLEDSPSESGCSSSSDDDDSMRTHVHSAVSHRPRTRSRSPSSSPRRFPQQPTAQSRSPSPVSLPISQRLPSRLSTSSSESRVRHPSSPEPSPPFISTPSSHEAVTVTSPTTTTLAADPAPLHSVRIPLHMLRIADVSLVEFGWIWCTSKIFLGMPDRLYTCDAAEDVVALANITNISFSSDKKYEWRCGTTFLGLSRNSIFAAWDFKTLTTDAGRLVIGDFTSPTDISRLQRTDIPDGGVFSHDGLILAILREEDIWILRRFHVPNGMKYEYSHVASIPSELRRRKAKLSPTGSPLAANESLTTTS